MIFRSQSATNTLKHVMIPIVRLAMHCGIPIQSFIDIIKEAYVLAAEETILKDGNTITDSQISTMTGVHRKDVKTIRANTPSTDTAEFSGSPLNGIIARWLGSPDYIDDNNIPLCLPYSSQDEGKPSFTKLVETISLDTRPKAYLESLLQLGYVQYDAISDTVSLDAEAYTPNSDKDSKLFFWGRNGADHLTAATTNVLSDSPPYLDRAVYHDGLTEQSVQEIRKISKENGMKLLRLINQKAFELSEQDKNKHNALHRFSAGLYFFDEQQDKSDGKH